VVDDLVGVGGLRQMPARVARLFALRPPRRRGVAGFLRNPSDDGGCDEFDESEPNRDSNSATRRANSIT
jgi:hypothetical protein